MEAFIQAVEENKAAFDREMSESRSQLLSQTSSARASRGEGRPDRSPPGPPRAEQQFRRSSPPRGLRPGMVHVGHRSNTASPPQWDLYTPLVPPTDSRGTSPSSLGRWVGEGPAGRGSPPTGPSPPPLSPSARPTRTAPVKLRPAPDRPPLSPDNVWAHPVLRTPAPHAANLAAYPASDADRTAPTDSSVLVPPSSPTTAPADDRGDVLWAVPPAPVRTPPLTSASQTDSSVLASHHVGLHTSQMSSLIASAHVVGRFAVGNGAARQEVSEMPSEEQLFELTTSPIVMSLAGDVAAEREGSGGEGASTMQAVGEGAGEADGSAATAAPETDAARDQTESSAPGSEPEQAVLDGLVRAVTHLARKQQDIAAQQDHITRRMMDLVEHRARSADDTSTHDASLLTASHASAGQAHPPHPPPAHTPKSPGVLGFSAAVFDTPATTAEASTLLATPHGHRVADADASYASEATAQGHTVSNQRITRTPPRPPSPPSDTSPRGWTQTPTEAVQDRLRAGGPLPDHPVAAPQPQTSSGSTARTPARQKPSGASRVSTALPRKATLDDLVPRRWPEHGQTCTASKSEVGQRMRHVRRATPRGKGARRSLSQHGTPMGGAAQLSTTATPTKISATGRTPTPSKSRSRTLRSPQHTGGASRGSKASEADVEPSPGRPAPPPPAPQQLFPDGGSSLIYSSPGAESYENFSLRMLTEEVSKDRHLLRSTVQQLGALVEAHKITLAVDDDAEAGAVDGVPAGPPLNEQDAWRALAERKSRSQQASERAPSVERSLRSQLMRRLHEMPVDDRRRVQ